MTLNQEWFAENERKLAAQKARIEELEALNAAHRSELADYARTVAELRGKIRELEASLAYREGVIAGLSDRLSEQDRSISEYADELCRLQTELAAPYSSSAAPEPAVAGEGAAGSEDRE